MIANLRKSKGISLRDLSEVLMNCNIKILEKIENEEIGIPDNLRQYITKSLQAMPTGLTTIRCTDCGYIFTSAFDSDDEQCIACALHWEKYRPCTK